MWTTHFRYVSNLLLLISASLLFLVVTCFCLCSSLCWYTPLSILCTMSRSKEFEQFEGCSWKSLKVRNLIFFCFFVHELFYQSLSCLFLFVWLFVDYAFVWLLVFVCLFKWFFSNLFIYLFIFNVYIKWLACMLLIQVCCSMCVGFVNILWTPLHYITCALCIYMFFSVMKGQEKCEFIRPCKCL